MSNIRNKKMTKGGSLTIPSDLRARYGYNGDSFVSMEVLDDGSILLRPNTRTCFHCGEEATKDFKGVAVCDVCLALMADLLPKKKRGTAKKQNQESVMPTETLVTKSKDVVLDETAGEQVTLAISVNEVENTKEKKPTAKKSGNKKKK